MFHVLKFKVVVLEERNKLVWRRGDVIHQVVQQQVHFFTQQVVALGHLIYEYAVST